MNKEEAMKLALEVMRNQGDVSVDEWIVAEKALREALAEQPAQQEPTVEDNSQNWRGMNGTTAYWLIQRHADGWADIGKMMGEWLEANQTQPAQQEPVQNNPLDCNVYLGSGKDHAIKHHVSYGPAQRTWVNATTWRGLTQQDIDIAFDDTQEGGGFNEFARAIEAKIKEKNQ